MKAYEVVFNGWDAFGVDAETPEEAEKVARQLLEENGGVLENIEVTVEEDFS